MPRLSLYQADPSLIERRLAYCLCLHVKPATVFVGVVNLTGSLFCMMMTLYIMFHKSSSLHVLMNNNENSAIFGTTLLLYPFLATISAMLIYGVMKSKPSYILPFFVIQFIDYLFTIPHFLANIYTHPMHRYYMGKAREQLELMDQTDKAVLTGVDGNNLANEHNMMSFSSEALSTSILLSLVVVLLKTYFLVIVFKCYRYLHFVPIAATSRASAFRARANVEAALTPIVLANSINSMPPNYDEATMVDDSKPPGYDVAVRLSDLNNTTSAVAISMENNTNSTNPNESTKPNAN